MLALFLLIGVASARGDLQVECVGQAAAAARLSLSPAAEEPGRYRARHCRPAPAAREPAAAAACQWDLTLKVLDQPRENCSYSRLGERPNGQLHSQSSLDFTPDVNCSYICLTQNVDLLFRGCYSVQSKVKVGRFSTEPYNTYHYVDNDLTPEYFHNSTQSYKPFDHEDMVSFIWETKIPITDYEVTMCKQSNDTEEESCEAVGVTGNCSLAGAHRLACGVRARGCRRLTLRHRAPWAAGLFRRLANVYGDFCHDNASLVATTPARGGAGWGAAAAVLGAAAALAALAARLRHSRRQRRLRRRVLHHWHGDKAGAEPPAAIAEAPLEGLLLLYARDCPALQRFATALATILRKRLGVTVWDLYSPESVCVWGSGGAGWVRAAMRAPRVRTLLLQTPALRLLHPAPATPALHTAAAEEPLVGGRVMHRVPHCGDALLALCVRALHAAPAAAYRRHYLAAVSSLEAEALAEVVPYRRYVLPGALDALLRDLAPPSPCSAPSPTPETPEGEPALLELLAAHAALLDYVRNNPDYLSQELMFI